MNDEGREGPPGPRGRFATTQWSLILAAGASDSPQRREALERLCGLYWPAVYAYVRRRGQPAEEARDLTQEFFARLLEKGWVGEARRERGRFRTFLLTTVKHFLANEWDRAAAQKRGGGVVPLELDDAESRVAPDPADETTPETLFERQWALTLLDRVLARLEAEMQRSGQRERFDALRPCLTGEGEASYAELAARIGIGESAVKVAVHRMRRRYGALLRDEVAQTVDDPGRVADEIRYLLGVLARTSREAP